MIFNMSGGGASLNFKVVGGTSEPANPKENTIWVNTDMEITSWIFSATQPESPAAGMVWITTGTGSPVAFNALKKNNIQVYPISAKQYVDGAWVDKTAKSYQNNSWVDWSFYWLGGGTLQGSLVSMQNASFTEGKIETTGSGMSNASFAIDNAQDLTGAKRICVKASITSVNSSYPFTFGIKKNTSISGAWNEREFIAEKQVNAVNSNSVTYALELNGAFAGAYYFVYSGVATSVISDIWIEM